MKRVLLAMVATLIAGCTAAPPPQPVAAAPAAPAPPPPGPAPEQQAAAPKPDQLWDVTRIRCDQLLAASDDDRSAATMFYYGYVAARARTRDIHVGRIEENTRQVMEACGKDPSTPAVRVFERILANQL